MREMNRQTRELRTADEDATDAFTTEKKKTISYSSTWGKVCHNSALANTE